MSTIKTEVHDITETRKKVDVAVAADEVATVRRQLIKEFQREAKIQGFRPGKAPENIILMRYAKELKAELAKKVITRAYQEGVGKSGIEVFNVVESSEVEVDPDKDVNISFTVDVFKEFELPKYEGLKVTSNSTKPSEKEVDAVINQILGQRAEFKTVEKAAETSDYVKCSYEGRIGEEMIADIAPDKPIWGTQKNTWEEAGTDHPYGVPAIISGLVGMGAGDKKEVTMDFDEDFNVKELAGKTATYSVEVEEVRKKILPEMDAAFFESMQLKDEAELRERISQNLEDQKKQQNSTDERRQITEQLVESVDFPLPESGIEAERYSVLQEFMQKNIQKGASESDFETQKEELHEEAGKAAHTRLKTRLILNKIALKENIQVENDDFGRLIMLESQQTGQKPEKIVKEIQKDQNRLNRMRSDIIMSKTLDLILEKAEREAVANNLEAKESSEVAGVDKT